MNSEPQRSVMTSDFLIAVLTLPATFDGEAELLEGLLEAGLPKLHIRRPGGAVEGLLSRLAPRWASRLVLHGSVELAVEFGIPQVHGKVGFRDGDGMSGGGPVVEFPVPVATHASRGAVAVSTSVHSWEEFARLPEGLAYAFISPLFDSISKPGYGANPMLLRQPAGPLRCMPVALGGVGGDSLPELLRWGWKGAAVLGWVWDEPHEAVRRYEQLKKILNG
ncbi:thiamine phosphate synthase [Puia sp. P3]|uniref:thiamine phosphate synthase n=1 Tax=Puia sp. P3 TaxID=3423952 RepID=UPI003D66529C